MSSTEENQIERVSFAPLAELIRQAAPHKSSELDALLARLQPICEVDRQSDHILFQASLVPCAIRIGVECTRRLQAHAYVAAIFLNAFSTSDYWNLSLDHKRKLYEPADPILNWAVARDLQQTLLKNEVDVSLDDLLDGKGNELPEEHLSTLNEKQVVLGEGLFRFATAFILLHELAHLHYGHAGCSGYWSIQQEKDADRFAAAWLIDSADQSDGRRQARRMNVLIGVAIALVWLTVINVYFGPRNSQTHPEGYDRLFQVLDQSVAPDDVRESSSFWNLVSYLLFVHMDTAGFEFDFSRMQGSSRDEVNYLIDLIAESEKP